METEPGQVPRMVATVRETPSESMLWVPKSIWRWVGLISTRARQAQAQLTLSSSEWATKPKALQSTSSTTQAAQQCSRHHSALHPISQRSPFVKYGGIKRITWQRMSIYLREQRYYEDIYDRVTVDECRRLESTFALLRKEAKESEDTGTTLAEREAALDWLDYLRLYFVKGNRWTAKAEAVRRMMDKDRSRDAALLHARPPANITCSRCPKRMELVLTQLETSLDTEPVVFYFRCNLCRITRAVFEGGAEYREPPQTCTQCRAAVTTTYEREGNKVATTDTCHSCGRVAISMLDLDEALTRVDDGFANDRERFCLSKEEGEEYQEEKANLANIRTMVKEWEERDPLCQHE
jgi:hypothetical protein